MKLIENALSFAMVQAVSLGLPLLSLPYLAAILGPAQLGRAAFALSAAQVLLILTDYGFNLSGPKAVSIHRDNPAKVAEIWCAVTLLRVAFSVIALACIAVAGLAFERIRGELGLLTVAYVMVIGNVLFSLWLFQGLERLRVVCAIQIASRFIVFAAIFFLVKNEEDVYWATFLQAAGLLLGGIAALPYTLAVLRPGGLAWPTVAAVKEQLRSGWPMFVSNAAISTYTASNAFLLGLFVAPSTVGHFHVAEKAIRGVQALYGPISNAVYPHVSRLAARDPAAVLRFNRKLLINVGSVAAVMSAAVYLLAPFLIGWAFSSAYLPAADVLRVLAVIPLIIFVSNVLGIQTMLPLGMESSLSKLVLAAALINLVALPPAAHMYGAVGAAWTNVVVELCVTTGMAAVLHAAGCNLVTATLRNGPDGTWSRIP